MNHKEALIKVLQVVKQVPKACPEDIGLGKLNCLFTCSECWEIARKKLEDME